MQVENYAFRKCTLSNRGFWNTFSGIHYTVYYSILCFTENVFTVYCALHLEGMLLFDTVRQKKTDSKPKLPQDLFQHRFS